MENNTQPTSKKNKVLMGCGIALVAFIIVIAGIYFTMFKTASTAEVCDKALELGREEMKKIGTDVSTLTEEDIIGSTRAECISDGDLKADLKGAVSVKKYNDCVMAAKSLDEASKCEY